MGEAELHRADVGLVDDARAERLAHEWSAQVVGHREVVFGGPDVDTPGHRDGERGQGCLRPDLVDDDHSRRANTRRAVPPSSASRVSGARSSSASCAHAWR